MRFAKRAVLKSQRENFDFERNAITRKLFKSLPLLQYILKTFDRSGTVLCGLRLLMIVESGLSER
jgi:hypothetical protein